MLCRWRVALRTSTVGLRVRQRRTHGQPRQSEELIAVPRGLSDSFFRWILRFRETRMYARARETAEIYAEAGAAGGSAPKRDRDKSMKSIAAGHGAGCRAQAKALRTNRNFMRAVSWAPEEPS